MGELYSASCECGYQISGLMHGVGWAGDEFLIVQCRQCHHIQVSNAQTKTKRCSNCRSRKMALVLLESPDTLVCPRCSSSSLRLNSDGMWD